MGDEHAIPLSSEHLRDAVIALQTEGRIRWETQRDFNAKIEDKVSGYGRRIGLLEKKVYVISAAAAVLGTIGGSGIMKLFGSLLGG